MTRSHLFGNYLVVTRGAGEMASAVAHCLHVVGFRVVLTETEHPLAIRRTVSFSDAVYDGVAVVEGVVARRADTPAGLASILAQEDIALLVDPNGRCIAELQPLAVIDAIMAKCNLGTRATDAPIVIALGPGFCAGVDCHAVIETNRGHDLARIIWQGAAEPNTGTPAPVQGHAHERVLRSPGAGVVRWKARIGELTQPAQVLGEVGGDPVRAPFAGVLRGAIREGTYVEAGAKIGDVDPRAEPRAAFTISDKGRAIAGATLQALLMLMRQRDVR